jgi:hypothetical protein
MHTVGYRAVLQVVKSKSRSVLAEKSILRISKTKHAQTAFLHATCQTLATNAVS